MVADFHDEIVQRAELNSVNSNKRAGDILQSSNQKLDRKSARAQAKKLASRAERLPQPPSLEEKLDTTLYSGTLKLVFMKSLTGSLLEWALGLLENNMKSLYEGDGQEGAWGWNPKKKRKELTDKRAKFIVAYLETDISVAASPTGEYRCVL